MKDVVDASPPTDEHALLRRHLDRFDAAQVNSIDLSQLTSIRSLQQDKWKIANIWNNYKKKRVDK